MEAKGCAKPMTWKDARRYFYWALRARVARSRHLAQLSAASPGLSLEERSEILEELASIDATTDNRAAAEALERVDISSTVTRLKSEQLVRSILELTRENHKATISGLVRFADNLSDEDRSTLITALQSSKGSPSMSFAFYSNHGKLTIISGPPSYS
jgi:acetyl-CoA carboxylase / biotin carboxylase 1